MEALSYGLGWGHRLDNGDHGRDLPVLAKGRARGSHRKGSAAGRRQHAVELERCHHRRADTENEGWPHRGQFPRP